MELFGLAAEGAPTWKEVPGGKRQEEEERTCLVRPSLFSRRRVVAARDRATTFALRRLARAKCRPMHRGQKMHSKRRDGRRRSWLQLRINLFTKQPNGFFGSVGSQKRSLFRVSSLNSSTRGSGCILDNSEAYQFATLLQHMHSLVNLFRLSGGSYSTDGGSFYVWNEGLR